MFKRKPSFVSIHIEDMVSVKKVNDHMKYVVKKINTLQSVYQKIINYFYYILTLFLPSKFYYNSYKVSNITIKNKKESLFIPNLITFYIFDNCVLFYGKTNNGICSIKIPYEYIMQFKDAVTYFEFSIFGTIDESFNYTLSQEKTVITFYSLSLNSFIKLIKSNMYYHIAFNKLDYKVIEYFTSKED